MYFENKLDNGNIELNINTNICEIIHEKEKIISRKEL